MDPKGIEIDHSKNKFLTLTNAKKILALHFKEVPSPTLFVLTIKELRLL